MGEAVGKAGIPDRTIPQADTAGPEISRRSCSTIGRLEIYEITDHPALKSVSGPIGQAGFDDGLDDLRSCPDRFDEFPVHARR